MTTHCEYCGSNGITTRATLRVSYMESAAFTLPAGDDDNRVTVAVCRECADHGCPSTATREKL